MGSRPQEEPRGLGAGDQGCGRAAGVRIGVGTKAWRLEWAPGEKLREELRSEHRTHMCAGPPGLGTVTLNIRQQPPQTPDRTQPFIHSSIYLFILSLHPLFAQESSPSQSNRKDRPVSRSGPQRSPFTHPSVPRVVSAFSVPGPEFSRQGKLPAPSRHSWSSKGL